MALQTVPTVEERPYELCATKRHENIKSVLKLNRMYWRFCLALLPISLLASGLHAMHLVELVVLCASNHPLPNSSPPNYCSLETEEFRMTLNTLGLFLCGCSTY